MLKMPYLLLKWEIATGKSPLFFIKRVIRAVVQTLNKYNKMKRNKISKKKSIYYMVNLREKYFKNAVFPIFQSSSFSPKVFEMIQTLWVLLLRHIFIIWRPVGFKKLSSGYNKVIKIKTWPLYFTEKQTKN